MDNIVFQKTTEKVRKDKHIEPVTTEERRSNLVSEPNYYAIKIQKIYQAWKWEKKVDQVIYEFWFDYLKPKYEIKAKLYSMDTDNFIAYMKTEDIHAETRLIL